MRPGEPGGTRIRPVLRPRLLKGFQTVKKLLLVALIGAGAFALYRKVQADRAELDLWTEATTGDSD
jgi:hypothetical protein